jgi:sulfatase modifying factor 1
MMTPADNFDWLLDSHGPEGDAEAFFALGCDLKQAGQLEMAVTALDRAYGLKPTNSRIQQYRQRVLNELAVDEHGILFRYIPAGTFLMGSEDGDHDEKPVHPVKLGSFWLSETPVSWSTFCELMHFLPPPDGVPDGYYEQRQALYQEPNFHYSKLNNRDKWLYGLGANRRIRLQYCEDETVRARGWHAHVPNSQEDLVGAAPRANVERPPGYTEKPMVAVEYEATQALGEQLTDESVEYRLPTEAEWEKAARGGLIGAAYPWGNEPPSPDNCDCENFNSFAIRKMKAFPANGYGLYSMCGGVWEWVSDMYDARYYEDSPRENPVGPSMGDERVLRGGAWTDDPEAVTVSFRMSRAWSGSPTIGFRLCRVNQPAFPRQL